MSIYYYIYNINILYIIQIIIRPYHTYVFVNRLKCNFIFLSFFFFYYYYVFCFYCCKISFVSKLIDALNFICYTLRSILCLYGNMYVNIYHNITIIRNVYRRDCILLFFYLTKSNQFLDSTLYIYRVGYKYETIQISQIP